MKFNRNRSTNIDNLFPGDDIADSYESFDIIRFKDLPYITRPIVEYLHDVRPSVVVAGDRGGRLFGISAFYSWKKRYPGEPFPTFDRKIRFARVSSRNAYNEDVIKAVTFTLEQAGVTPSRLREEASKDGASRKVVFLDDWAVYGDTFERFLSAANMYGIPRSSVAYATMCGKQVNHEGVDHVIGDPSRDPRNSDWNDSDAYPGVCYSSRNEIIPVAEPNYFSMQTRVDLRNNIDDYYRLFTDTIYAGRIVTRELVGQESL